MIPDWPIRFQRVQRQPVLARPTPFSARPFLISARPTLISARPTPISARPTPISARPTPFSARPTLISARPTLIYQQELDRENASRRFFLALCPQFHPRRISRPNLLPAQNFRRENLPVQLAKPNQKRSRRQLRPFAQLLFLPTLRPAVRELLLQPDRLFHDCLKTPARQLMVDFRRFLIRKHQHHFFQKHHSQNSYPTIGMARDY